MTFSLTREFLAGRLREHLGQDDLASIEGLIESMAERIDGEHLVERSLSMDAARSSCRTTGGRLASDQADCIA